MLLFRLCLQGVGSAAHPDELRDKLNSRQIAEWLAYECVEPFGMQHVELLSAMRMAQYANAHRRESDPPAEPRDFMPSYVQEPMTPEEIARNLKAWKQWQ